MTDSRRDDATPWLRVHYRPIIATTGCSAPATDIGIDPHGGDHLGCSLGIPWQVLTFRIRACVDPSLLRSS